MKLKGASTYRSNKFLSVDLLDNNGNEVSCRLEMKDHLLDAYNALEVQIMYAIQEVVSKEVRGWT